MSTYRHKQGRKGGLLLTAECQGRLVNVEAAVELQEKTQHSATIKVKTGSGENYQWILNLGRNSDKEQDICMVLKCSPIDRKG